VRRYLPLPVRTVGGELPEGRGRRSPSTYCRARDQQGKNDFPIADLPIADLPIADLPAADMPIADLAPHVVAFQFGFDRATAYALSRRKNMAGPGLRWNSRPPSQKKVRRGFFALVPDAGFG
jgi:hypothetical protein